MRRLLNSATHSAFGTAAWPSGKLLWWAAPLPGLEEGDRTGDPGSIKLYESGILLCGSDRRRRRARPIAALYPFVLFEIFIMAEEVLDLITHYGWEIRVASNQIVVY